MTIGDYIGQKFSRYGGLTEADILEFGLISNLSPDDEVSQYNMPEIEKGMIKLIPSLLFPESVNESGFSISWDKDGLHQFYLYLCKKNNVETEDLPGLSKVSSYTDY